MELLKSELTSRILRCAFSVYNELGPFLREYCYQRAMQFALSDAGLRWERQKRFDVEYRGRFVGRGIADLLVENEIVLELKALETIHPVFLSQLITYLSASGKEVGFVLNFGHLGKLEYKRCVLTRRAGPGDNCDEGGAPRIIATKAGARERDEEGPRG